MPHIETMFDNDYIKAFDLAGKDVTVLIERVEAGEVSNRTKKAKKPLLYVKGQQKPLVLNKTNAKVICQLYGKETDAWIGKRITIYPTTVDFGGETVEAIRVRPKVPETKQSAPEAKPS
jgi:hypothetical protein